jgi:hypothetical protein
MPTQYWDKFFFIAVVYGKRCLWGGKAKIQKKRSSLTKIAENGKIYRFT